MAILMFTTSAGLAIDMHYCKGDLQSVSFFSKAKSCHEKAKTSHCHKAKKACHSKNKEHLAEDDNCCDNQSYVFQLDTDYEIFVDSSSENKVDFHKNDAPISLLDHKSFYAKNYKNYKPPSLDRDHIVLIQSFLL